MRGMTNERTKRPSVFGTMVATVPVEDSGTIEHAKTDVVLSQNDDSFLIDFDLPMDRENPKDWSMVRKWMVTSVLSASGFNRILVSTIMAPALTVIGRELKMTNTESVMSLSVYLLATAFGPLAIGPLSEVYGRAPVLHATNIWFLVWNIVCGFAYHKGVLIAARLLAGFGASAIYALGSGVLADVWPAEQRGRSLGLYLLVPLLGAAVGPIAGGYITEYTTWRWMFWSTSCIQAFMIVFSFLMFKETHGPTILYKRAERLRQTTNDKRFHTATEKLDRDRTAYGVLRRSLSRPVRLLALHPLIQIQASLSAFTYGITYFVLSSFSDLWTSQYHESVSRSGLHYFAMCLGEIVGALIGGPLIDLIYRKLKEQADGTTKPENHVPMMIPGAILAPIGIFVYGWAAEKHMCWFIVDLGAFIVSFGSQIFGQALQAYTIGSYPDHTSSASAATQFLRSLTAFAFPLFAPRLYAALGYGWGNSVLGFTGLAIYIPAPIIIWIYGPRFRASSRSSY